MPKPAPSGGRRRIILVLGMHRSGTSVTMNVLNALGVPLSDDLMPPTQFNQKGYFESQTIARIHDDILKAFGMEWSSSTITHPLPAAWWRTPAIAPLRAELVEVVNREFEKAGPLWGFKDPRTARLLPLWNEIVAEMDLDPSYVLVSRHPRDCARSLFARERVHPFHAELLWLEHNADAIAETIGRLDAIVEYNHWFDDPRAQAEYLIDRLALEHPGSERLDAIVAEIVSTDLRHHVTTEASYELPFSAEFYEALSTRNIPQLQGLTNIFQATRRFAQIIVGHATRELIARVNESDRVAGERGQEVASLQAQQRALASALQAMGARERPEESGV